MNYINYEYKNKQTAVKITKNMYKYYKQFFAYHICKKTTTNGCDNHQIYVKILKIKEILQNKSINSNKNHINHHCNK